MSQLQHTSLIAQYSFITNIYYASPTCSGVTHIIIRDNSHVPYSKPPANTQLLSMANTVTASRNIKGKLCFHGIYNNLYDCKNHICRTTVLYVKNLKSPWLKFSIYCAYPYIWLYCALGWCNERGVWYMYENVRNGVLHNTPVYFYIILFINTTYFSHR